MPELPEVETIVRSLRNATGLELTPGQGLNERPGVVGSIIAAATVNWARSVAVPSVPEFLTRISHQTILEVSRRGKFLQIRLDKDWLLIHLRMSGELRVEPDSEKFSQPHDRVIIHFTDGIRLVFNDPRKFGRIWLVDDPQRILGVLGPEPFSTDLTDAAFYEMLQKHKTAVKVLLMNQRFISGLGNIYTDEALHIARIHPLRKANSCSPTDAQRLLRAIRDVLQEGIERNGASIDWVYRGGDFQNYFKVYHRNGQACTSCGAQVEKIMVGQRSTHFCPVCQVIDQTKL